jgi:glycosyltransferase involved in cell wall biosynthesis
LQSRPRESRAAQPTPDLTVILPFRNASRTISDQLEALARQDFDGRWELIAVDNRSEDGWREIVERFQDRLEVTVVAATEHLGGGHASNVGARHARSEKLVFVDADDVVAPGYLSAMAAALEEHEFVTAAFDQETLNPSWVRAAHGPPWRDGDQPLVAHFGVLPNAGASMGIARSLFESVGGFPDDLPRMYDIALSWEVQFAGTPLHFVPEALYRVRYRDNVLDLFRQGFAESSCAPLLYKRYRNAGMTRRSVPAMLKSWARLAVDLARARTKADLAPLGVRLGRELGRLSGSIRHRVYFP